MGENEKHINICLGYKNLDWFVKNKNLILNHGQVVFLKPSLLYLIGDGVTILSKLKFLNKKDLGLGNVDNTSDSNKPISTATQNALNLKENTITGNDHRLVWSTTVLSGFTITDNLDGTIDVSSGQILIRTSNSESAPLEIHSVSGVTALALTDNSVNYLYVDYNSGTPVIQLATDIDTFNGIDKVITHKLSREGTEIHYISVGTVGVDSNRKLRRRFIESETFTRGTGLIIGETGNRYLTVTSGKVFYGLTRVLISAVDTSGVDTFKQVYHSGGSWVKSSQTQVNNTQYNNAGTLTVMTNNRYRVDYIYMACNDNGGILYLVLGDTQYNSLSDALNAPAPSVLQAELVAMGVLIGRVIIKKNDTNLTAVETAFGCIFNGLGVTNHNDLANLNVGDYLHLTAAEYQRFNSRKSLVLDTSETTYGLDGTSNNKIVYSKLIPGGLVEIGDIVRFRIRFRRIVGFTGSLSVRAIFGPLATSSTGYHVALMAIPNTQYVGTLYRSHKIISNTTAKGFRWSVSFQNDEIATADYIDTLTISNITNDWYFNIQMTNGATDFSVSWIDYIELEIIKNHNNL